MFIKMLKEQHLLGILSFVNFPSVFVPSTSFMKDEFCLALYLLGRSKSCGDGIGNVDLSSYRAFTLRLAPFEFVRCDENTGWMY